MQRGNDAVVQRERTDLVRGVTDRLCAVTGDWIWNHKHRSYWQGFIPKSRSKNTKHSKHSKSKQSFFKDFFAFIHSVVYLQWIPTYQTHLSAIAHANTCCCRAAQVHLHNHCGRQYFSTPSNFTQHCATEIGKYGIIAESIQSAFAHTICTFKCYQCYVQLCECYILMHLIFMHM